MSGSVRIELFESLEEVEKLEERWDALAVALGSPYCSPAWMLSWWRHVAPRGAELRVVAAVRDGRLVTVAPFYLQRGPLGLRSYRLLAGGTSSPVDVLADADAVEDTSTVIVQALHARDGRIDVVVFEGIPEASQWPRLIARKWPGSARFTVHPQFAQEAPYFEHRGRTYEEWFADRGPRFRRNMRHETRLLARAGGSLRVSTTETELGEDLTAFARLHRARWQSRGRAGALTRGVDEMIAEAGRRLLPQGRIRVSTVRIGESVIASFVVVSAGRSASAWLGGFDPEEHRLKQPAMLAALGAVEHSFASGDEELDWGAGTQWYKSQFTEAVRHQVWTIVARRGWRAPLARSLMLRSRVRQWLASVLSPEQKRVLRGIRARLRWGNRHPG